MTGEADFFWTSTPRELTSDQVPSTSSALTGGEGHPVGSKKTGQSCL